MFKNAFHFDFTPSPVLRLSEVEKLIRQYRVITPAPCRQTLINWIEEGILEGHLTFGGYYVVTERSFKDCVLKLTVI